MSSHTPVSFEEQFRIAQNEAVKYSRKSLRDLLKTSHMPEPIMLRVEQVMMLTINSNLDRLDELRDALGDERFFGIAYSCGVRVEFIEDYLQYIVESGYIYQVQLMAGMLDKVLNIETGVVNRPEYHEQIVGIMRMSIRRARMIELMDEALADSTGSAT